MLKSSYPAMSNVTRRIVNRAGTTNAAISIQSILLGAGIVNAPLCDGGSTDLIILESEWVSSAGGGFLQLSWFATTWCIASPAGVAPLRLVQLGDIVAAVAPELGHDAA